MDRGKDIEMAWAEQNSLPFEELEKSFKSVRAVIGLLFVVVLIVIPGLGIAYYYANFSSQAPPLWVLFMMIVVFLLMMIVQRISKSVFPRAGLAVRFWYDRREYCKAFDFDLATTDFKSSLSMVPQRLRELGLKGDISEFSRAYNAADSFRELDDTVVYLPFGCVECEAEEGESEGED